MTLSKREKTLLFILTLLIISFVSWTYVITPMLQANQEAKLAYVAAQEEQEHMERLMPTLIGADERLAAEQAGTSNLTQTLHNCSFELWGTLDGCMKALDQFSKMENSVLVDFFEIKFDKNKQKYVAKVDLIFYFVER